MTRSAGEIPAAVGANGQVRLQQGSQRAVKEGPVRPPEQSNGSGALRQHVDAQPGQWVGGDSEKADQRCGVGAGVGR